MKYIEKITIGSIVLLAAIIRLYRIGEFLVFLGDEGRDALVVKGILEGHFTLLGPRASAGDFFTGPIYYYMMAPALWLSRLDPIGPAIMVALFGTATVFLIYFVGKRFFSPLAGIIAAALYAVSPLVVTYSRSSWNPNTVPFFSLLTIYMLFIAVTQRKKWHYFIIIGVLLGILVQLHYISLFLGAAIAVALFLMQYTDARKIQSTVLINHYLQIFAGFLVGFSPFLLFELRHNFQNIRAISAFITGDTLHNAYETYHSFYQPIADVFFRNFARLVFAFPLPESYKNFPAIDLYLYGGAIMLVSIAAIAVLCMHKNKQIVLLLASWLFVGTLLFGFYKKPIHDYYLVFLFPLPFLIIGNFIAKIATLRTKKLRYGYIISSIFVAALCVYNSMHLPLANPNNQKQQMKTVADAVLAKTDNKPFNFALLSSGNSDHAYRYYFSVENHNPVALLPQGVDTNRTSVTDQLMVVCEDKGCHPLGHPLFEIAGFGPATIAGKWEAPGVIIYKLVHTSKR